MKDRIKWIVLGLLLLAIFLLTFMKTPEAITSMLQNISKEVKSYSAFVHILFLVVIGLGLLVKKIRNSLFSLFIAFLSLSATIISVKYVIAPNIIIFAMFLVLIIHAYLTKNLNFDLKNIAPVNLVFGIIGMVFGFWYLHWVQSPVWLNALLYSPLGAVNCPTMVTICGFLCLSQKPRSAILEAPVALTTLYFGFFGIFRLGAYVDVPLIICALFLIVRLGSYLTYEDTFGERKDGIESKL
ncbi:MAG: hypothetical protein Q6364_12330 [Candidatus Hermodarchaeota archaeon]|nr:hypothetical protein [Candidatus Hermodarchaeota archaeon]